MHNLDQTKIKIIAGDLPEGFWELSGSQLRRADGTASAVAETINLSNNVKRLDLKDEIKRDKAEQLVGSAIGALFGLRFGPVGAALGGAAGYFVTQNQHGISVICELKDGRQFMAAMAPNMYQRLREYV